MAGELGDAPPPFVTLEEAFASFAGGAEMDGSAFVKCLRGAGILDRSMTTVEADLIFAKHKRTGGRRINFQAFLAALRAVADRKAMPDDRVMELVCVAGGPSYSSGVTQQPDGTGPERFFYDESTYTGTHKTGRVSVPGEGHREFSDVVNRGHVLDDALQRRRRNAGDEARWPRASRSQSPPLRKTRASHAGTGQRAPHAAAEPRSSPRPPQGASPGAQIRQAQPAPAPQPRLAWQAPQTPEDRWAQSLRLEGSPWVPTQRPPTPQTPPTNQKENAPTTPLPRGPERFFYDKSTYTGVHAMGGPTTVDGPPRVRLEFETPPAGHKKDRPRPGARTNPAFGPERFFYDKSTYTGVHKEGGPGAADRGEDRCVTDLSEITRQGLSSGRSTFVHT